MDWTAKETDSVPGTDKRYFCSPLFLSASTAISIVSSLPGVKWPGRETNHSPPFISDVKRAKCRISDLPYGAVFNLAEGKLSFARQLSPEIRLLI
jgi:hypothetical protein